MNTADPETLMDAQGVANLLGVSKAQVYRLTRKDELPKIKIGASIRYRRSSIMRWIEDQEN